MRSWRAALGAIVATAPDQAVKIQLFLQEMRDSALLVRLCMDFRL